MLADMLTFQDRVLESLDEIRHRVTRMEARMAADAVEIRRVRQLEIDISRLSVVASTGRWLGASAGAAVIASIVARLSGF
jgi:hypothetical protein